MERNKRKMRTIMEIYKYCKENKITNFSILLDYAKENNNKWFKTICENGEDITEMLENVEISLKKTKPLPRR